MTNDQTQSTIDDGACERGLTDEATVGKDKSCTDPHAVSEGPERASNHDEVVVGWVLGVVGNRKSSGLQFSIHNSLTAETKC